MKSIEDLDRWIGAKVKGWAARLGGAQGPAVLEIHRDILEDVRDRLQPKGGGRYVFPYNHVVIHIGAADEPQAGLYGSAFADLEPEIRALLAEAGASAAKLAVELEVAVDAALAWTGRPFRIEYRQRQPAAPPPAPERPPAKLVVLRGAADAPEYAITANRVNIGRLKEVFGENQALRRWNDVAFADTETSVSREHAFVTYDAGRFRICDDQSQRGTSIFREGRRIAVPKGSRRGTQLQAGDEIHLGEARLRFEA